MARCVKAGAAIDTHVEGGEGQEEVRESLGRRGWRAGKGNGVEEWGVAEKKSHGSGGRGEGGGGGQGHVTRGGPRMPQPGPQNTRGRGLPSGVNDVKSLCRPPCARVPSFPRGVQDTKRCATWAHVVHSECSAAPFPVSMFCLPISHANGRWQITEMI